MIHDRKILFLFISVICPDSLHQPLRGRPGKINVNIWVYVIIIELRRNPHQSVLLPPVKEILRKKVHGQI